jgi:hypothetical protein
MVVIVTCSRRTPSNSQNSDLPTSPSYGTYHHSRALKPATLLHKSFTHKSFTHLYELLRPVSLPRVARIELSRERGFDSKYNKGRPQVHKERGLG